MKTASTPQGIINHLMKCKSRFGDDHVEKGLHLLLGWYHTYRKESWQITIADRYIFVASAVAAHPLLEADMVYDLEIGRVIIDSRGLYLKKPMTIQMAQEKVGAEQASIARATGKVQ